MDVALRQLLDDAGLPHPPAAVADNVILVCQVGSRGHGCTGPDGGDTDLLGVFVEPPEAVMGLSRIDQHTASTGAADSTNTSADADLKLYSLRRLAELVARKGNPSAIDALFAPVLWSTALGDELRQRVSILLHRQAGTHFLGYMQSQRQRMRGERSMRVNRPELVARHGYDVKFAYQLLRLGIQGAQLMRTGHIQMPMRDDHRQLLMAVRRGDYTQADVETLAEQLDHELREAIDQSKLPDRNAIAGQVDRLLVELHRQHWAVAT